MDQRVLNSPVEVARCMGPPTLVVAVADETLSVWSVGMVLAGTDLLADPGTIARILFYTIQRRRYG